MNILIILIIAELLKIDQSAVIQKIYKLKPIIGRGSIHKIQLSGKKLILLDESYNSNPISLNVSLDNLNNISSKKGHVTTSCQHSFCFKCFMKWIDENNTCPLCRTKVKNKNIEKIIEVEIEVPVIQEVEIEVITEVPVIKEKIIRVINLESYLISMGIGFMLCLCYYSSKNIHLEN